MIPLRHWDDPDPEPPEPPDYDPPIVADTPYPPDPPPGFDPEEWAALQERWIRGAMRLRGTTRDNPYGYDEEPF